MTSEQQALKKKIEATWPEELRKEKRWCAWFKGDLRPDGSGYAKIPRGSHSDPATWDTFEDVWAKMKPGDGVGYNFLGGDVHPWDLDHVRNNNTGIVCNEAMVLLSRWMSFSEVSVSGRGLHVLTRGEVRGQQLTETCLQYWNPAKAPRFFTVTGELVGQAFSEIKDIKADGNYVFATAAHISAKCREELKAIDPEQWQHLPAEPIRKTTEPKEKSKTKSRKLHKDFNLEDFLKYYNLTIDNVASNNIGKCYRLATCPIKGEPHVGQNSTTTNFILSNDGGLGFHCQSTGCVDWTVAEVIKKLAEDHGPYPGNIYEEVKTKKAQVEEQREGELENVRNIRKEHKSWLWPGYLFANQLVHIAGASAEGKSPLTRDIASRLSSGNKWPDGTANEALKRGVIMLASEDDWASDIIPHLELAGADLDNILKFRSVVLNGDVKVEVAVALDQDVVRLKKKIMDHGNIGLVIIDPITNYLGRLAMNKEEEIRPGLLMPLADMAHELRVCVLTVGHLNKRTDGQLLDKVLGARAFTGVARQTLFCMRDPDDDSKFAHIMGLGRQSKTPSLKYKTQGTSLTWEEQTSEIVTIAWGDACEVDIEEAVCNPTKQRDKSQGKTTREVVRAILRDGAKPTEYVEQALKEAGIDSSKFNWQREAAKVAKSGKGGPEHKGEKFMWWLDAPKTLFDKDKQL